MYYVATNKQESRAVAKKSRNAACF